MPNPFSLPEAPQHQWTPRDHQRAANFHFYEMQGYSEAAYQAGDCDANYAPLRSLHQAAHQDHTRKAAQGRLAAG